MLIATWNINDVRKRMPNLLDWLGRTQPDVVCLQEIKCADMEFPHSVFAEAGYGAVWAGQRTWHGVAILARGATPVLTRRVLPGDPADTQARYVEAAVNGVLIASLYLPNGNPRPGPKYDYKLSWFRRLVAHAATLRAAAVPAVLAGDYNVVPTDFDIYPSRSWRENALVQPEPRALFAEMLDQGWTDALRSRRPVEPCHTFWDYKRAAWERDAGLRIDHLLLSPELRDRLQDAGVDRNERGMEGASDHAPAWVRLGRSKRDPAHLAPEAER